MTRRNIVIILLSALASVVSIVSANGGSSVPGTWHSKARTIRKKPNDRRGFKSLIRREALDGCGMFEPSAEKWHSLNTDSWLANITAPIDLKDPQVSLADELFTKLAPGCPKSACHCDGFQSCSLGSTLNIAEDLSCDDKMRAYMVLESISNVANLYMEIDDIVERTLNTEDRSQSDNLVVFTRQQEVDRSLQKHQQQQALLAQFLLAFIMVAAGPLSAFINPIASSFQQDPRSKGFVQSLNSEYHGFIESNVDLQHVDKYYDEADQEFKGVASFLGRALEQKLEDDGIALLSGRKINGTEIDLPFLISGGKLVQRQDGDAVGIRHALDKIVKGVSVNYYWAIDRGYIVMADVETGKCEADNRGLSAVRVCLPDFPDKSFWVYMIPLTKEFEIGVTQIKPLQGWQLFSTYSQNSPYTAGLVQEDVVRSSLHWYRMHGNVSPSQLINDTVGVDLLDPNYDIIEVVKAGSVLPGTFRLPIFKNPGGEAISSIFTDHSRNFPCIAGDVEWSTGLTGNETDSFIEMERFLQSTGYYGSHDWLNGCRNHECHTRPHHNKFHFRTEAFHPNSEIRHPFHKCHKVSHTPPLVGKNDEGYMKPAVETGPTTVFVSATETVFVTVQSSSSTTLASPTA